MKIGIDIDGVLNSQYNFCIDYGTKFCNEIGKYKLENVHAIDTTDMFLWDDEVAHKFWNKYRKDLTYYSNKRKIYGREKPWRSQPPNKAVQTKHQMCKSRKIYPKCHPAQTKK